MGRGAQPEPQQLSDPRPCLRPQPALGPARVAGSLPTAPARGRSARIAALRLSAQLSAAAGWLGRPRRALERGSPGFSGADVPGGAHGFREGHLATPISPRSNNTHSHLYSDLRTPRAPPKRRV